MFNSRTISETDVLIGITYTKMLYVFLGLSVIPLYKIACIGKTCSARVLTASFLQVVYPLSVVI